MCGVGIRSRARSGGVRDSHDAGSVARRGSPARLADHARRRFLRIERTWSWAKAFTTCWQRLTILPVAT
jgi:hypothetical protein